MATIKEIAMHAGVSIATVSYVLNGTKKLSKETTERVNQAIQELNYIPNTVAKNLRNGQTRTIGILIEDIRCTPTPEILNGIAGTLEKKGYQMLVHDLHLYEKIWNQYEKVGNYKDHINNGLQLLKQSMVAGIIYVSMHMRYLDHIIMPLDIPLAYAYACCPDSKNYVMYDDVKSAEQMTQHLIELGHRNIAIISGPPNSYAAQKRLDGILSALKRNAIDIAASHIKIGDWEYNSGYEKAMELLQSQHPTAIFAMNDIMAAGAYKAAYECHLKIPEDISIVGFDNREIARYLQPPLTTMNLPLKEIGEQTTEILIECIEHDRAFAKHMTMPCKIIKRESSYRPNALFDSN